MEGATRKQRAAKVAGGMADQECFKNGTVILYARLVTQLSRRCGSSGVRRDMSNGTYSFRGAERA